MNSATCAEALRHCSRLLYLSVRRHCRCQSASGTSLYLTISPQHDINLDDDPVTISPQHIILDGHLQRVTVTISFVTHLLCDITFPRDRGTHLVFHQLPSSLSNCLSLSFRHLCKTYVGLACLFPFVKIIRLITSHALIFCKQQRINNDSAKERNLYCHL